MDRSTLSKVFLFVGLFFLGWVIFGKGCGKDGGPNTLLVKDSFDVMPLPSAVSSASASASGSASTSGPTSIPPSTECVIDTKEFTARVGSVGGGLLSYQIKGAKYSEGGKPIDIAQRTTIDANKAQTQPHFAPLRATFRNDSGSETQVSGDLIAYDIQTDSNGCTLSHVSPELVDIKRVIRTTDRPYELSVETTIKNLSTTPRKHSFSTALYALQFKKDEGGMLKRPAPNDIFQASCGTNGKIERKERDALKTWVIHDKLVSFAALSTAYLGQAILPLEGNARCALIAQERAVGTDREQYLYRAHVSYPQRELAQGGSATYREIAFIGPKERQVLANAAGGKSNLDLLIDLGTFAVIAKFLVWFLGLVKGAVGSWGIAIIIMTISVRLLLMPLTIPQIRSSIAMRRIKPEMDALNAKFASDPQAKMIAIQQLYKRHNVNPLAGCLPALLQMPVWFALYSALQTAIELYHEPFLFWSDLTMPDPRFIIPLVLKATMFVQQKVTPMQMDPAQQKIFLYFMPAMFTIFMLFSPAGLGVYMLTNSLLGIAQTVATEKYMAKKLPAEIKVTQVASGGSLPPKSNKT